MDVLALAFCTYWHRKQHWGKEGRAGARAPARPASSSPHPKFLSQAPSSRQCFFFTKMIDYLWWQPLPLGSTNMILPIENNNHLAGTNERELQHFLLLWLILEKVISVCDLVLAHRLYWGSRHSFFYMLLFEMCGFLQGWGCSTRENLSMCLLELDLRGPDNTGNLTEVLISVSKIN